MPTHKKKIDRDKYYNLAKEQVHIPRLVEAAFAARRCFCVCQGAR